MGGSRLETRYATIIKRGRGAGTDIFYTFLPSFLPHGRTDFSLVCCYCTPTFKEGRGCINETWWPHFDGLSEVQRVGGQGRLPFLVFLFWGETCLRRGEARARAGAWIGEWIFFGGGSGCMYVCGYWIVCLEDEGLGMVWYMVFYEWGRVVKPGY